MMDTRYSYAMTKLTKAELAVCEQFLSPLIEASFLKGVTMDALDEARRIAKLVAGDSGKIRVRFRGKRHDQSRLTCLKKDAVSAAIYIL